MNLKIRLTIMNFLEFAAWGAYLTCMGRYLGNVGLGSEIGWFYSMQGIVSIFMPAIMGIIADRWLPAQKVLGLCHLLAGVFMMAVTWYGASAGNDVEFSTLFTSLVVPGAISSFNLSHTIANISYYVVGNFYFHDD